MRDSMSRTVGRSLSVTNMLYRSGNNLRQHSAVYGRPRRREKGLTFCLNIDSGTFPFCPVAGGTFLVGTCSATVSTRPSTSLPLSARVADRAPSGVAMVTMAKPRGRPLSRSSGDDLGDIAMRGTQVLQIPFGRGGGDIGNV